jgi:CO/xanthine dehydrogenase FAD-binding subunit
MSFLYAAPSNVDDAVALLAAPGARALAGGTDLLVQMRSGRVSPSALIDIKRIPRATGIRRHEGGFAIGAATPCTALEADDALRRSWPGVVEAANLIGSVQVRNRATIAGNLCNASPAADSVPALIAAGARGLIVGPKGERDMAIEDIVVGPGRNALGQGELLLEIRLPARPSRSSDAYLRSIPRSEMDIAVVGAAVSLSCDSGSVCREARVALAAVAPTALLVPEAGQALIGGRLDQAALERMEAAVEAACRPISDKRGTAQYRTAIAAVMARRSAAIAYARAMDRP